MPFSHILGQPAAVTTLVRALQTGRVHHAYRFEGPEGVGKELTAFALAQALVCTAGDPLGCGVCDACHRAITRSKGRPASPLHPDVSIVARNFYPAAIIGKDTDEIRDISVYQVRSIVLSHAAYGPHEGRGRIFIIKDAEELNIEAANALLKTLEEPRQGVHFVLLTSRADRLLPTIRSRTLPIRFAPLPEPIVRGILETHGIPKERHDLAVELASGSASLALEYCDDAETTAREGFVQRVVTAANARDLGKAIAVAEGIERDKSELKRDLRALGATYARAARGSVVDNPASAAAMALRYDVVARAIINIERNASPNLTMISMITELRHCVG